MKLLHTFTLIINDDSGKLFIGAKQKEFGPVVVEIDSDAISAGIPEDLPGAQWELINRIEKEALEYVRANLEIKWYINWKAVK